jgi:putative DNA primase/helicase
MTDFANMQGMAAPMLPTDDFARAWWDLNDSGNSSRFVSRHSDRFLFVRSHGWHAYDGKAWTRDGAEDKAMLAAEETARAIKDEAKALFDAAEREKDGEKAKMYKVRGVDVKDWAETSGGLTRIKSMLSIAAAKMSCALEDFDADPLALNVQNGTLRFFKGPPKGESKGWAVRLDPHDPADRISRICAVDYNPDAPRALWDAHMARSFTDFRERWFVLRSLGYCLLGLMTEQVFFIWQGRGGDGKSVTANAVRRVMGSYAAKVDVKTFLEDKTGRNAAQASPDIARLAGATRFVVASEPPKGAKLNEALVKEFTGGAPLLARFLNKDPFEFIPRFRLVIDCNPLPSIGGADDGIWRRIVLISWREQLKREDMDPQIEDKLVRQGEGVLASLVEAALRYFDRGLDAPETIRAAASDYKSGSNAFREWYDSFCIADPAATTLQKTLYGSFKEEMERQGVEMMMSSIAFGKALADMQHIRARQGGSGDIVRKGVRLLTAIEREDRAAPPAPAALAPVHNPSQAITSEAPIDDVSDPAEADAFKSWIE